VEGVGYEAGDVLLGLDHKNEGACDAPCMLIDSNMNARGLEVHVRTRNGSRL
jgi:hypothetical protein